jgi:flagellar biosynthesis/type III secretory pathway protein FliH
MEKEKKKITIAQKLGARIEQKRKTRNENSEKKRNTDGCTKTVSMFGNIKNKLQEAFHSLISDYKIEIRLLGNKLEKGPKLLNLFS